MNFSEFVIKFYVKNNFAELKASYGCTNLLLQKSYETNQDSDSDSDDFEMTSVEQVTQITELYRNVSTISTDSLEWMCSRNSSSANIFLAPKSSAISITNEPYKAYNQPQSTQISNNDNNEEGFNLGFTRAQLKNRLDNLVKLSLKNFNGDVEVKQN